MAQGNTIGKAYIQLVPTADGMKANIERSMGGDVDASGKSLGSRMSLAMKTGIAAGLVGIGKAISSVVTEGGELEQAIGGIETLFKDNAEKMKNLASGAYESAGLSATQYMQQVTMFSASLLQSLGGDTKKAGDYAHRAIVDMSDNANKLGTNIEMIQNAYQGFAKANYTMLDNLRLGYGGTKEEMARLITDTSKMKDIQKELNLTVKDGDMSFGNIINAISVMQKKLDITGTTALEASTTLNGSFAMMKSSFDNFLGQLALGDGEIGESFYDLVYTVGVYMDNLLRMVGQTFKQIPDLIYILFDDMTTRGLEMMLSFSEGFVSGFPSFMEGGLQFVQDFANLVSERAPIVIEKGFEMLGNLVDGIINAIPVMIERLPTIISTFANVVTDNMPTVLMKGAQLLYKFITGILSAIPTLIANIPQIIKAIWDTIMAVNWWNLGKSILTGFTTGIKSMFGTVKESGSQIFKNIWDKLSHLPSTLWNLGKSMLKKMSTSVYNGLSGLASTVRGIPNTVMNILKSMPSKMLNIGKDLVKGLWNGISNMTDWIIGKIKGFGSSVLNGIKSFFGIHSPSRVFRDEVGKMLPLGMAKGIENGLGSVDRAMQELQSSAMLGISTDMSVNSALNNAQFEEVPYLEKIVQVLLALLEKEDKEIVLNANNREIARYLKEMGVVFE